MIINGVTLGMAMLSNSQSVVPLLERLVARSYEMFLSRAYLHQYSKYGVDDDTLHEHFMHLEQVLQGYREL